MQMNTFSKHDWSAFAGAEGWHDAAPLIGEGNFANGERFVLVLDATGGCLVADDEQADYGGYQYLCPFLSQQDARAFAERIGEPGHKVEFLLAGFKKV